MRSLADISALEKAYELGAKSLGTAALALNERWVAGLRDEETFIRLAFLGWYSQSEPGYLTGLDEATTLPPIDELLSLFGGASALSPDSQFVLGLISRSFPECCGDPATWQERSGQLFALAASTAPTSPLFTSWQFLFGDADEPNGLRRDITSELHARFSGRGYMGTYVQHVCGQSLARRGGR